MAGLLVYVALVVLLCLFWPEEKKEPGWDCPYERSDRCSLCGSKESSGGSWSPDRCCRCGAYYFMGRWVK